MSRTWKDKPYKLKYESYLKDTVSVPYTTARVSSATHEMCEYNFTYTLYLKTTKPKKRKKVDTESHWMSTPSWWTKISMIRPQRREGSLWERDTVKTSLSELEEVDKPSVSRKPHKYFW